MADSTSAGRRFVHVAAFILLTAGVVMAVLDGAIGWFIVLTLLGGGISALLLIAASRRHHVAPAAVPDAFRGLSPDAINMSHIRVAGVGGLGMTVVAMAVAYVFPRIGLSLALGLIGGFAGATAVILHRRRTGPLASGSGQIGGRSVLVEDSKPVEHRS